MSHSSGAAEFIPAPIREQVDSEFVILERMEMSLEERLKGSRGKAKKEDLLALDMRVRRASFRRRTSPSSFPTAPAAASTITSAPWRR